MTPKNLSYAVFLDHEMRASMGWFKRKIKHPIMGTAQITSCGSPGNPRAIRSTCHLFVVVEGPGLQPAAHEVRKQVEVARWPHPGMTLPCRIDPDNPSRFEIDFDAIPNWKDNALAQAERAAAARATGSHTPVGSGSAVTVVGAGSQAEVDAAVIKAEGVLGMDLNGDGRIA